MYRIAPAAPIRNSILITTRNNDTSGARAGSLGYHCTVHPTKNTLDNPGKKECMLIRSILVVK
jgi:hypothetical protein